MGAGGTGAGSGDVGVAADSPSRGPESVQASSEALVAEIVRTLRISTRSAATKTGLYGAAVQLVGVAMVFWALVDPEEGTRYLTTTEFMTVVIAGVTLIAIGPYVGKLAAPKAPNAGELVREAAAEVDARQVAELKRRKREADAAAGGVQGDRDPLARR